MRHCRPALEALPKLAREREREREREGERGREREKRERGECECTGMVLDLLFDAAYIGPVCCIFGIIGSNTGIFIM